MLIHVSTVVHSEQYLLFAFQQPSQFSNVTLSKRPISFRA